MKKSLLALAVLGAFSGAAFAQTSVTVYGLVDAGLVRETGGAAGAVTKLTSGVKNGSRWGLKGTEDLGGGLAANFLLEGGFHTDTGALGQGGLIFGRQAYVGLSGGFGSVNFGRQYAPIFSALDSVDPFGTGLAGASTHLMSNPVRMNNTVKYSTANLGGFTGSVAYGFGEVAGDTAASRQFGLSLGYANGPVGVTLAHHNTNNPTDTVKGKLTLVGGTYDFGMVKAYLAYQTEKNAIVISPSSAKWDAASDARDILVGVSAPVGAGTILASYIRKNDRTAANQDADQIAIGYVHALSKRTNVYTSYARISNDNGAVYTVGNATEAGSGNKAFNVGVQHKF